MTILQHSLHIHSFLTQTTCVSITKAKWLTLFGEIINHSILGTRCTLIHTMAKLQIKQNDKTTKYTKPRFQVMDMPTLLHRCETWLMAQRLQKCRLLK